MMNHTHAVTGAVGGMALLPVLPHAVRPDGGVAVLVFALAAAGAATLPDFDHPESTASNFIPPLTTLVAVVVSMISGGHRHAAHWYWTAIPVGFLAVLPAILGARWVMVPVAGFLAALALYATRLATRADAVVGGVAVAALALYLDHSSCWWVGVATAVGYLIHSLGDTVFGGVWGGPGWFVQAAELNTGGVAEVGMVRPLSWAALGVVTAAFAFGWGLTLHYLGIGAHGAAQAAWLVFHPHEWFHPGAGTAA